MYCSGCGQGVMGGGRFCPRCGRAMQFAPVGAWDGLMRPRYGRKVAGVCAAMAARYGWDLTALRLITALLALLTFPCVVIVYLILWVVLPEEPLYMPVPEASHPMNTAS